MDLRQVIEVFRVPLEVVIVPGHPHPGIDRQDGPVFVHVKVDHGHAELHHDGLERIRKINLLKSFVIIR